MAGSEYVVSDRVWTIACSPYSSNGDRGELRLAVVCSRGNAELALVAGMLRYTECAIKDILCDTRNYLS